MVMLEQLALTMIPGIGSRLGRSLLADHGGVEGVFRARRRELLKTHGVGLKAADMILKQTVFDQAEQELIFMQRAGVTAFFITDDNYPARLKECYDAPLLLYYKGSVGLDAARMISIVGTRAATAYGRQMTERLVSALKEFDVLVVSGLAHGIDARAHRSCVQHEVPTVGVLGHGLDRLYPHQNRNLAEKMLERGGWLTEFPSGTLPDRENFPKRNRIIAGLADATIVVEAGCKGGALITAGLANSYNREVFAFPGNVGNEFSAGCNFLIRTSQAHLATSAADIARMMGWTKDKSPPRKQLALPLTLSPDEHAVIQLVREHRRLDVDQLAIRSSLTPSRLAASLLNLEMHGLIRSLPGKHYEVADQ